MFFFVRSALTLAASFAYQRLASADTMTCSLYYIYAIIVMMLKGREERKPLRDGKYLKWRLR